MKFSLGLILAAVAVTTAHAGNPKTLRGVESTKDSGVACPDACPDKYSPVTDDKGVEYPNKCYMQMAQCRDEDSASGSDVLDLDDSGSDDLMIDLTDLFGSDSGSSSKHVYLNLEDLIGSGSDQVTLDELMDALDDSDSGSSDDGSDDLDIDLAALFGSGSDASGSYLDDIESLVGSNKLDLDSLIGSGSGQVTLQELIDALEDDDSASGSDDSSLWDDDSASLDDDAILVKGTKETATKSSKSTKASKSTKTGNVVSSIGSLFDEGSDAVLGDASDEEDPTLVKGALEEEDSDEDDDDEAQQQQTLVGEKKASKSSKTIA